MRARPDRPSDPYSPTCSWYRLFFPEVKRSVRDVEHPPPCSAEDKERVGLYLYSPFMDYSMASFTFYYHHFIITLFPLRAETVLLLDTFEPLPWRAKVCRLVSLLQNRFRLHLTQLHSYWSTALCLHCVLLSLCILCCFCYSLRTLIN